MKKKILCFFGTRPEAIKMAPVVKALQRQPRFKVIVAVSAQHRDMLDQVMELYQIKPHIDLNLMQEGQSLSDITVRVLKGFDPVLKKIKPDMVLIHGDTTTTLGGSLSSFYHKIPVGHVEAGLRTRDMMRPYPEEMNRRVSDTLATLYFAPTQISKDNLSEEHHSSNNIFVTGNTVIDALHGALKNLKTFKSPELRKILEKVGMKKLVLMTAHRRENFGQPFKNVCLTVEKLSRQFPNMEWIYPVHPNPNVKGPAYRILKKCPNVHLIDPLDYGDLVLLMNKSFMIVTDSGGLQEEGPALGKPVLVLREVTERPEAVKAGTVKLVGTDPQKIMREFSGLVNNRRKYQSMARATNPYGDGKASIRIKEAIEWYFGIKKKPPPSFKAGT